MLDYTKSCDCSAQSKGSAHISPDGDSSKYQWTALLVVPFSLGSQGEETVGTVFLL